MIILANSTETTAAARNRLIEITGWDDDQIVGKAIQLLAKVMEAQNNGGCAYIQETKDGLLKGQMFS